MSDDAIEADRPEGAPHPRETTRLFGQEAAERAFLSALGEDRLHHAWLISGPRGVGKATLAWRVARYLISEPAEAEEPAGLFGDAAGRVRPASLDIPPESPVARRIAALSEPGLMLIRRAWDTDKRRLKTQIGVDEVRKLNGFFGLTATDGGRRVVIADSVDELNASAANALLKVLEEPPKRAILLLVSHNPARLLPTIRSRCREVRCQLLAPDAMRAALAGADNEDAATPEILSLASGSVGEAIRLAAQDGAGIYARLVGLMSGAPGIDRTEALKLADHLAARGAEERLDVAIRLIDILLARLAKAGAGLYPDIAAAEGEADLLDRLSPGPAAARAWADCQQEIAARIAHGRAVNVDVASLLIDAFLRMDACAGRS